MNKPRPIRKVKANANTTALGNLGENFVKAYLLQKNWQILAEQWHCRWGELDLVAYDPITKIVAFVEVKTRRPGSLDQQGILAITPSKQRKIIKTALQFLAEFPAYENYGCRFDVALVSHQGDRHQTEPCIEQFILEEYLEAAFEVDEI
jgi:putative endonuclease